MASARIALLSNASSYVGPAMACEWARRGHDLVLGDPTDELVAELQGLGVQVEAVTGVRNLARPGAAQRLVDAAMARFGRIDAAAAFSGQIIGGKFLDTTLLRRAGAPPGASGARRTSLGTRLRRAVSTGPR
jgi:NAD(P)-dependent dehydrogenase (short-subunit alcohol dehydrogenase family)